MTRRTRLGDLADQLRLRALYVARVVYATSLKLLLRLYLVGVSLEAWLRPPPASSDPKRVLLIVIGGLGDCLLFEPLFRRLKEEWPGARIDVLTGNCFHDLWDQLDSIDERIHIPVPGDGQPISSFAKALRAVRRNRYDIVAEGIAMISPHGIYAVLPSLVFLASRAPVRIGGNGLGRWIRMRPHRLRTLRGKREPLSNEEMAALYPRSNSHLTHVHEVLWAHDRREPVSGMIFEPLGLDFDRTKSPARLRPRPDLQQWAHALLHEQWGSPGDIVVGVTLDTTYEIKSWPTENFLTVLEKGIADGLRFVMIGVNRGLADPEFAALRGRHLLDLSGHTALGEMIAIVDSCDVFLSADVGPSHVAQACGVPSVVLFGPSNDAEYGPIEHDKHTLVLPPGDLPCRPCVLGPCVQARPCMQLIEPDRVYEALRERVESVRNER